MKSSQGRPTYLKGWIDTGSDVSWDDYHGQWAKRGRDGAWWILTFTNMHDAMGERDCKASGAPKYECAVKRLDLSELPEEQIKSALGSCGWRKEADGSILCPYSGDIVADAEHAELCIVDCCVRYGFGAPMHDETGDHSPIKVRGRARHEAERLMRDEGERARLLARPVNKIGSTAAEYGRGDITTALFRTPDSPTKAIIRKMTFGAE